MGETGGIILAFAIIFFLFWLEWTVGRLIGNNVSRSTGVLLGIVLMLLGFSFLIGVSCIIHSQQNANAPIDINANINHGQQSSETIECPSCAEIIKRKAKICRYCDYELKKNKKVKA